MYKHICEGTKCEFYVVWDYGYADCYSCTKIGQSHNVLNYPEDCPHINEMQKEDPNGVGMKPTTNNN